MSPEMQEALEKLGLPSIQDLLRSGFEVRLEDNGHKPSFAIGRLQSIFLNEHGEVRLGLGEFPWPHSDARAIEVIGPQQSGAWPILIRKTIYGGIHAHISFFPI